MKNLIYSLVSILLFSFTVKAQILTETTLIYPGGTNIVKIGSSTYEYGSYAIGKEVVSSVDKIYRTYFSVNLSSIPTTATIQEVKVNYSSDYKSYSFKLTNVTSLGSGLSANWAAIGSASALNTGIGYGAGSFISSSIKTAMQSALAARSMIIGGVGENETASDSYAYLSINLEVRYTRPADQLTFVAQNDMDGQTAGNIGVGVNTAATSKASPHTFNANETNTINLQAYDNQSGFSYTWIFNDGEAPLNPSKWELDHFGEIKPMGSNASVSRTAVKSEEGSTIKAYLRKICNVTFQNSAGGGTITVNGTNYSSPASGFQVVQANEIKGTAVYHVSNGIEYIFDHWSDGSTQSYNHTFTPSSNQTYTAYFTGRPNNSYRNLNIPSAVGQPITLDWDEHPNTAVTQYAIYRKVKHNGVLGSEQLIGTRSRGTTTYTDNLYTKTSSYVDLVYYDVRAYYSTEGTYSSPDFISVYGETLAKPNDTTSVAKNLPAEFSLSNYPNPFNPSTNINFTIPEAGNVKLTIYNMLGEKVREIVNRNYESGNYTVKWNGDNQFGRKVISGVYFSVLQTDNKRIVQKMILSK